LREASLFVLIDRRSGHFQPDETSLQIAKQKFEAAGFEVEIAEGGVTPPSAP
jgi:hypothetical protein